jgi:ABC-type transport system involved in Fe-S cluster assembly fused permease/ATPase subunit
MRIMDRGSWAMRSILQTLLTQIVPQGFDVIISVTYLATKMHFWVAVILLSTIVLYVPLTIYGAKRRNEIQRCVLRTQSGARC